MALAAKPKKSVHNRKRQAKHHRRSKTYLKSYWPYLPMLLIVGLGISINSAWSKSAVLGAQRDFSSDSLLVRTNQERQSASEAGLTLDPQLAAAAQAKATDMVQQNYWAHTSPDGKTPWTFITSAGYPYQAAGENLAYGFSSANEVITGWMNSPEHRSNILGADYKNVGFGVANSPNYLGKGPASIVVAEYGEPVAAAANITFTVPAPTPSAQDVKGASQEIAAKRVSRVQLLSGGHAQWSLAVASAILGAALALFVVRHGLRIHRLVSRGEAFVAHHPYFDIGLVLLITVAYLLTRTTGLIR